MIVTVLLVILGLTFGLSALVLLACLAGYCIEFLRDARHAGPDDLMTLVDAVQDDEPDQSLIWSPLDDSQFRRYAAGR